MAPLWLGANGTQLEISANFSLSSSAFALPSRFGLWVLAGSSVNNSSDATEIERTVIEFDSKSKLVSIDRRFSGNSNDSDVRAGPWPKADISSDALATDLHIHAYVDRSIVEVIVNGQTAITVYVHPQRADSVRLAVFADWGEVTASVDVHQMSAAPLIL